ncbi:MAG TPA: NAD(P)/FAD-dependent oxidoreductase [Balneolales bacterium]|nr:NAD(P)/FAD-dependent oxidoreductase [Balneolales bacterium]
MSGYDAVIVGAGPNGLAAAITLAREGRKVVIFEEADRAGGGLRSCESTLPGFVHDICSAVHPLAYASPFFRTLPLSKYGLEWVQPDIPMAHPLSNGNAVSLYRSIKETSAQVGQDKQAYEKILKPLADQWKALLDNVLGPLRVPLNPLLMTRFGWFGLQSAASFVKKYFTDEPARALLCGLAAHSMMDLNFKGSAAFGLILGLLGHTAGWPFPRGGAEKLAEALIAYLKSMQVEIVTDHPIRAMNQMPPGRAVFFDITPRQLLELTGTNLPESYRAKLRNFRYGMGVCKVDWALSEPIPFTNENCRRAGTLHIGGFHEDIIQSEKDVWKNVDPDRPFVILAQHTVADPSRAPEGKHTGWAYCHVPPGSDSNRKEAIESQIERFAPGFKDTILGSNVTTAKGYSEYNPNYIGGDINGGVQNIKQLFLRPVAKWDPYQTGNPGLYLCSSSTPPGGGVHGMCGYNAAQSFLRKFK